MHKTYGYQSTELRSLVQAKSLLYGTVWVDLAIENNSIV